MTVDYGLRRTAWLSGERPAIHDSDRTLSYHEFRQRVNRVANMLSDSGVEPGDRVAVLMLNSPKYPELYYATAQIGALIVPLDIGLAPDELAFCLSDSEAKLLLVDSRFAGLALYLIPNARTVKTVLNADHPMYERLVGEASADPPAGPEPADGDVAGLFYTGGATGGAKGVMLTHRNLHANALHLLSCFDLIPEVGVWLHAAPMFHLADAGALFATTMVGAAHAFIPNFEPEGFLTAVERYRVTHTILAPTMIDMLVDHPAVDKHDTSSLLSIAYDGAPIPLELLKRAIARFGNVFQQSYGVTEAAPLLTWLRREHHTLEETDGRFAPVRSAGQPVLGVDVRVVDPEGRELPPGEIGEVIARGDNIMKGYWRRPEITAQTLRNGWLHTGNLGSLDERGFLYILDREQGAD